jgi:NAD(P)-dependent dehydrogenase (short-subunit alcohol dehydrogenase family)
MGRVEGKVALVAGAGGGIGGAGAEGIAREGAAVVCADIDAAAAEATAARIRAAGGRATAIALDVRDRSAVDAAVAATVREFGRLDVLLNCAGVSHGGTFVDLDYGEWERVIAVNLTGMFHLGQAAAQRMVHQGGGGSIINVTSQLAEVARPERAAYVASKGGGRSLTHAMALDLAAPHSSQRDRARPDPDRPDPRQLRRSRAAARDDRTDPAWPIGRSTGSRRRDPVSRLGRVALGDRQLGHRRWRL